jgi:fibronectin type 3 domain-containing protein
VRLLWHGSDVEDLAGYLVYRRRGTAGEFVRMTPQPIQELEYIDTKVASRQTFFYRVTAVDKSGNESAPSGETATPVP